MRLSTIGRKEDGDLLYVGSATCFLFVIHVCVLNACMCDWGGGVLAVSGVYPYPALVFYPTLRKNIMRKRCSSDCRICVIKNVSHLCRTGLNFPLRCFY